MKKSLIVLSVLLLSLGLVAQQRTGNIYGKISDTEGNPLPGVTVTVTSSIIAPITTVTNDQGMYRFPSLGPASDYSLTAELKGFKKTSRGNIIVTIGTNVLIDLTMELGALEEEVTVTASTPIVDVKKTATATNVSKDEMQSLPTARDPWVVMQLAPSIMLDRENVGGNESGQQSSFLAKGDSGNNFYYGANNIWSVDGIDITDPAALGGSALYYDFDMFEELNITTGGADVSVQTGGIAINMVTRRGGNRTNLAGRFYLTDRWFQAYILNKELEDIGRTFNKIETVKDYGFNAGGPILKDKVWWWGGYGVQDIFTYTVYKTQDKTLLNNYNFKLNAQIFSGNRAEFLITAGAKEKYGRNAATSKPEGDHQTGKYHFGSPILKFQDEQVFGNNFYVALKYSFNDAGFGWVPMVDEAIKNPVVYNVGTQRYDALPGYGRSWGWYYASRPRNNAQANATYYNDNLLGLSHEIKMGLEFSAKHAEHKWGNKQNFQVNINYTTPTLDLNGDGTRDVPTGYRWFGFQRQGMDSQDVTQWAGYLSDTITAGRFTFILGLRYDFQDAFSSAYEIPTVKSEEPAWKIVSGDAQTAMEALLPPLSVKEIRPNFSWKTWSPRLGITWDITGDGKTIAKLALAQYGDIMGTGWSPAPLGLSGSMGFWWKDTGDNVLQLSELYWMYSSTNAKKYQPYPVFSGSTFVGDSVDGRKAGMWSGFDWNNPGAIDYETMYTTYPDESKKSSRTREFLVTVERELFPDFGASVNFTMRRYDNFMWWQSYYPDTGEKIDGPSWYRQAGTIPAMAGEIPTGEASGRPWYTLNEDVQPTDFSYVVIGDNYRDYWGVDFILTKRLSNKWYMNASFTWQNQSDHWGTAWGDATNKWCFDGEPYTQPGGGASGKTTAYMFSKWLGKLSWLYQLPFDINVSGTLVAREGWRIPHYLWIQDTSLSGLYNSNTIYTQPIVNDALPTFYNLTFRVEKMLKIGDFGRLYLMADIFNVLNKGIENRRYDAYYGDWYVAEEENWIYPDYKILNEILNPRITRFGARFTF